MESIAHHGITNAIGESARPETTLNIIRPRYASKALTDTRLHYVRYLPLVHLPEYI